MKKTAFFIAFVVVLALTGGALLHAIVPHEHGDASDVVWGSLHASLTVVASGVGAVLLLWRTVILPQPELSAHVVRREHRQAQLLRRGILAHRKFR